MDKSSFFRKFRFDQQFKESEIKAFLLDLFNSDAFRAAVQVQAAKQQWQPLGRVTSVNAKPVPCTLTSMSLFDAFKEAGIVAESGYIRKCCRFLCKHRLLHMASHAWLVAL